MEQMAWEGCQKDLLGLLWCYLQAREGMSKCAVLFGLSTAFSKLSVVKGCFLNRSSRYQNKYLLGSNETIKNVLN